MHMPVSPTFRPPTAETSVLSPLRAWLDALAPGQAVSLDGLSVIALIAPASDEPLPRTRPLGEALASGEVIVREHARPRVDRLVLENAGDAWVLGLAGELVVGGKQDRALSEPLLVAPGERRDVAANCVERGRWSTGDRFASGGGLVDPQTRTIVQTGRSLRGNPAETQHTVWSSVGTSSQRVGVRSPTESYRAVLAARARRAEALAPLLPHQPGQRGLLVISGDRLVCCDVFADEALFAHYRPQLLGSIVAELERKHARATRSKTEMAKGLLAALRETAWEASAGHGEEIDRMAVGAGPGFLAQLQLHDTQPSYLAVHPHGGGEMPHLTETRAQVDVAPLCGMLEIRAPEAHKQLSLPAGRYIVGRSSRCQIRLLDPCISRQHLELRIRDDATLSVRDLDSTSGTVVGNERVSFAEVEAGETIVLAGPTTLSWTPAKS